MLLQELPYQLGLVSREVVENDVDLRSARAQGDDFLQESNEILTGSSDCSSSVNSAGGRLQRDIEG